MMVRYKVYSISATLTTKAIRKLAQNKQIDLPAKRLTRGGGTVHLSSCPDRGGVTLGWTLHLYLLHQQQDQHGRHSSQRQGHPACARRHRRLILRGHRDSRRRIQAPQTLVEGRSSAVPPGKVLWNACTDLQCHNESPVLSWD